MTENNKTNADGERSVNGNGNTNATETDTTSLNKITNSPQQPLRSILKVRIPTEHDGVENEKNGKTIMHKKVKKKRRDKSDLGDDFVAPDGGWGWLVAIAAGINIFVTFGLAQNFGIIFRGHMLKLGITTAKLTTIINIQIAVSAITGLLNGPLFRRFTFRQVALVGSFLTFVGLFFAVFAETFIAYVLTFSCCYGLGRGLTVSASSLAVNTYFKVRRRTATAYQFGVAGLGPIIFPYVATYMIYFYDVEGTVLIFAALSLHTVACSLIYQPVMWHVKKVEKDIEAKEEEPLAPEAEMHTIVEPDTPTLPRSNDGWYGSRLSLNSVNDIRRRSSISGEKHYDSDHHIHEMNRLNSREHVYFKQRTTSISYSIKEEENSENDDDDDYHHHQSPHDNGVGGGNDFDQESLKILTNIGAKSAKTSDDEDDAAVVHSGDIMLHERTCLKPKTLAELELEYEKEDEERRRLPFYRKVIIFFDLDLLRDFGYVNLALGLTLINFVEINFAILTPFILADFGFTDNQIAFAMSSLGFCDLVVRFLVPLITAKMNFSNKTFFIIGIAGMCFGRMLLAFTRNFYFMVAIFVWLGLNKAFRTVFWSLIIPGYVPLKRLPAAAGLQLLMSGIFSLACGPLIGLIRDHTSYGFALQFLNILCVSAVGMWLLEEIYRRTRKPKPKP